MLTTGKPSSLVCVSRVRRSNDNKVTNRRTGLSKKGKKAKASTTFHRGKRFSAMAGFTVLDGFLPPFITMETFTASKFLAGIRRNVIPHMGPYPGPRSVLLLDNARIHGALRSIIDEVRDVGARVEFLEPYDPEHMPIEFAFRAYKRERRSNRERYTRLTKREAMRAALTWVGTPKVARQAFREAGFSVDDVDDDAEIRSTLRSMMGYDDDEDA